MLLVGNQAGWYAGQPIEVTAVTTPGFALRTYVRTHVAWLCGVRGLHVGWESGWLVNSNARAHTHTLTLLHTHTHTLALALTNTQTHTHTYTYNHNFQKKNAQNEKTLLLREQMKHYGVAAAFERPVTGPDGSGAWLFCVCVCVCWCVCVGVC